jgi:hypothetical protein
MFYEVGSSDGTNLMTWVRKYGTIRVALDVGGAQRRLFSEVEQNF